MGSAVRRRERYGRAAQQTNDGGSMHDFFHETPVFGISTPICLRLFALQKVRRAQRRGGAACAFRRSASNQSWRRINAPFRWL